MYTPGGWGYVGGFTYTTTMPISGTDEDVLYQSERWWNGMGTYKFTVANGVYNVELRFAEIYSYAHRGGRVFDIRIEGALVRSNVDIVATAGMYHAYDVSVTGVVVTDGVLQIDLAPRKGSPKINAIRISP